MRGFRWSILLTCAWLGGASAADAMSVASLSWTNGGVIGHRYAYDRLGCSGGNISPQVSWQGAPAGTRSFAVTVLDLDAPGGAGWWHWIVLDVPPSVAGLAAGAALDGKLPAGAVQARSDFGPVGYGGPCPPGGATHRYRLEVVALDVARVRTPTDAHGIEAALRGHVLARAALTARFSR